MSSTSPKRPEKGPVGNLNTPITPLKLTLKLPGLPRKFKIVPEEKREGLVKILPTLKEK